MNLPLLIRLCFACVLYAHLCSPKVLAEVTPEQLLVIANKNNSESLRVADYYIRARNIPKANLVALDIPSDERIERKDYEQHVVTPLRKALAERKLSAKIIAALTVHGVPLHVAGPGVASPEADNTQFALTRRSAARSGLLNAIT